MGRLRYRGSENTNKTNSNVDREYFAHREIQERDAKGIEMSNQMKPISGEPIREKYALPTTQSDKRYNLDFLCSQINSKRLRLGFKKPH